MASLSKVFPVLAVLKLKEVNLDDSVTKYLPELRRLNRQARERNALWTVDWDEITIGALASHLGGIGADLLTDLEPYGDFTPLGFPPGDPSSRLNCSGLFGLVPCDQDVFYSNFGKRPPVYQPFSPNTVYSNIGWALLGQVIEKVTGVPSGEYIRKNIWEPSGMKNTFASVPDDKLGFIPLDDVFWNVSLGFEAPGGEYYTTINDIHAFGHAVLSNTLLSPAQTRKWLKPVSGTSSPGIFVGQPWEIFRSNNLTRDGRIIDVYTKAGDLISYHSIMGLVPDYDLVISILVAGPEVSGGSVQLLFSDILKELLPAFEQAGKDEAAEKYVGTYTDTQTNSSITLSIDDQPGLSITNWTVRGIDIPSTYLSINLPPSFPTPPNLVRFRLYPAISTEKESSWRAVATVGTDEEIQEAEGLLAWEGGGCNTWATMDRFVYQLLGQDHFVFGKDELELVGYRVKLRR